MVLLLVSLLRSKLSVLIQCGFPVITTILGAFLGSYLTKKFSLENEEKKLQEEIKSTLIILKSEYELNVENLNRFNELYLKKNISGRSFEKENELYLNFYKNLVSFPILCHSNWDNSKKVIHHIFIETHIKEIIEFNRTCDMLKEKASLLHKKCENENFMNNIVQEDYNNEKREAYKDIISFESDIEDVIRRGKRVLNILDNNKISLK